MHLNLLLIEICIGGVPSYLRESFEQPNYPSHLNEDLQKIQMRGCTMQFILVEINMQNLKRNTTMCCCIEAGTSSGRIPNSIPQPFMTRSYAILNEYICSV
jgi:hypothetical protein